MERVLLSFSLGITDEEIISFFLPWNRSQNCLRVRKAAVSVLFGRWA